MNNLIQPSHLSRRRVQVKVSEFENRFMFTTKHVLIIFQAITVMVKFQNAVHLNHIIHTIVNKSLHVLIEEWNKLTFKNYKNN